MRAPAVTTPLTPSEDLDHRSPAALSAYIQRGARREDGRDGRSVCEVSIVAPSKGRRARPPPIVGVLRSEAAKDAVSGRPPRGLIAPTPAPTTTVTCPVMRARSEAKARTEARRAERDARRDEREMRIAQLVESEEKTGAALERTRERLRDAELAAERARGEHERTERDKDAALARCANALAVIVGDLACVQSSLAGKETRCRELDAANATAARVLEETRDAHAVALRLETAQKDAVQSALEASRAETAAAIESGARSTLEARTRAERVAEEARLVRERETLDETNRLASRLETTRAELRRERAANEDFVDVVRRHESRALDLTRRLRAAEASADEHASLAEGFEGRASDRDRIRNICDDLRSKLADTNRHRDALADELERARAAAALANADATRREATWESRIRELESALEASRRDVEASEQNAKASRRDELRSQERVKALETMLEACEKCKTDHEARRCGAVDAECAALSRLDDSERARKSAAAERDAAAKRLVTVERELADATRALSARGDEVDALDRALRESRRDVVAKDAAVERSERAAKTALENRAASVRALASERDAASCLRRAHSNLAVRHESTLADVERLRARVSGAERAAAEAETARVAAEEAAAELENRVENLAGARQSLTETLAAEAEKLRGALARCDASEAEAVEARAGEARAHETLRRVREDLDAEKIATAGFERQLAESRLNERRLDERCERLATLANDLGNECARLTTDGETLETETNRLRSELATVRDASTAEASRGKLRERYAEDLRRKLTAAEAALETLRAGVGTRLVPVGSLAIGVDRVVHGSAGLE